MKDENQIKEEIDKIKKRLNSYEKELKEEFPEVYKSFSIQCDSKIRMLEWVLNKS